MGRGKIFGVALSAVALGALASGVPASAARTLAVPDAAKRDCTERPLQGEGIARDSLSVAGPSWVSARLDAAAGDWDLALFDSSGRPVATSAYRGSSELAEGFTLAGSRLTVQACRRSGAARTARLSVKSERLEAPKEPERLTIVRVLVPNDQRRSELSGLNLDLTEHGGPNFVEAVLHGEDDARVLRRAGFSYTTVVRDVAAASLRDRRADSRAVAARLPSGREGSYRRLADYSTDMKQLAAANPTLVKPITLRQRTLTGRPVEGIEVTAGAPARDGKPVFLQMGAHHAREWPSAEHAMEWAYELVNGYKANNPRVRNLMGRVRTVIVPVVNPDGFNVSREAGEANGVGAGRPGVDENTETANLVIPREYQRKNCRVNNPNGDDPEQGDCSQPTAPQTGLSQFGTDPNRNYGGFWGGPGASAGGPAPFGDYAQDYRGDGPFSERETQNVRDLVASRQVTTLITNHTFSNLVLRPPGIRSQGPPFDEGIYNQLGQAMANENGYSNQPSYDLYDTTGGTEDWTYYSTGGLGFTFEIGLIGFHPPYANTIEEYEGTSAAAQGSPGKGGNREAYFKAMENAANPARHSVIAGNAGAGNVLRLHKSFQTATSPVIDAQGVEGDRILFGDVLDSTMQVPASGNYELHANPSTRPIREISQGRAAIGTPSAPNQLANDAPAPQPPCPVAQLPTCVADHPVTVPDGAGVDNSKATFSVTWGSAASDYDVEVYEDTDANGVDTGDPKLGTSAQGTTNGESTTVGDGEGSLNGKRLILRVINFAGVEPYDATVAYRGPDPFQPAAKESWRLTCETPAGRVLATRSVQIDRGQAQRVDFGSSCPAASPAGQGGGGAGGGSAAADGCASGPAGSRGTRLGPARLGRLRRIQRRNLGRRLRSPSSGIDRYCLSGGGVLRVGYPTARLNRSLGRTTRRRLRNRTILVLTSSRRFPLARVRVGHSTRTLRRRLRGERSVVVGKNRWYFTSASKSRLVYRVQGGKVREVGLAAGSITRSRLRTARLLRAWDGRG